MLNSPNSCTNIYIYTYLIYIYNLSAQRLNQSLQRMSHMMKVLVTGKHERDGVGD